MTAVHLDDASVEAIAQRVVDLMHDDGVTTERELVDATEIARRFGLSRDYLYEHADELGAVRLGDGPRARLRFDPTAVAERLGAPPTEPRTQRPTRRKARISAPLLPVKGGR